jgi:hypothetical protein
MGGGGGDLLPSVKLQRIEAVHSPPFRTYPPKLQFEGNTLLATQCYVTHTPLRSGS